MTPQALKRARHSLGLSVEQMAEALGVTARHVRRMELEQGWSSHRPISPEVEDKVRDLLAAAIVRDGVRR